jgi:hypothetical protein
MGALVSACSYLCIVLLEVYVNICKAHIPAPLWLQLE